LFQNFTDGGPEQGQDDDNVDDVLYMDQGIFPQPLAFFSEESTSRGTSFGLRHCNMVVFFVRI
jgi:hypothetical protein